MTTDAVNIIDKVWEQGVLVQASMGMWSMEAPLKSKDVGLKEVKKDLIKLGHKRLISKREKNVFTNIRTKTSQLLDTNGFAFLLRGAHYVPHTILDDVLEELQKLQDTYNEKADKFIDQYAQFREEWFEENTEYVDILRPYYPAPEKIRPKFYFRFFVYKVRERLEDVDVAKGQTITEGDYTVWLEESINDLRRDISTKVTSIQTALVEGRMDNRVVTRIRKLKDHLMALDIVKDEVLMEAVNDMQANPTVESTRAVLKKAIPLSTQQVRKLYL